jgi:ferritin
MLNPQTESALNKMVELEKSISRLYALYAKRFPSHQSLWATLSEEETEHAEWLSSLAEQARDGDLHVAAGRFKTEAVKMALNSLEKHILEAERGNPSLMNSLSIAVTFETSLLEKDFFRIHVDDSAEMKSILDRLAAATENHRAKIQQAWRAARSEAGL